MHFLKDKNDTVVSFTQGMVKNTLAEN